MSVYLRGNTYYVRFKFDGEPIHRSARTAKKREAIVFEKALRAEIERRKQEGLSKNVDQYTYGEALQRWIETSAPKSMYSHARNTQGLNKVLLLDIVPATSRMVSDFLKDGLSNQTINRRLAVVKRVLNLAFIEWGMLEKPIAPKIRKLSEKGLSREVYLTKDQVKELVSHVTDLEARKVIVIASYTGLRRSELLNLTEDSWKAPYVLINNQTKSGKPRTVPVIEELHDLMTPPFHITDNQLRVAFEGAREKYGNTNLRFHDLRHTFASWLVGDPDIPLTLIRDLMGHSSLTVTSKYAHIRGANLDVLEKALSNIK